MSLKQAQWERLHRTLGAGTWIYSRDNVSLWGKFQTASPQDAPRGFSWLPGGFLGSENTVWEDMKTCPSGGSGHHSPCSCLASPGRFWQRRLCARPLWSRAHLSGAAPPLPPSPPPQVESKDAEKGPPWPRSSRVPANQYWLRERGLALPAPPTPPHLRPFLPLPAPPTPFPGADCLHPALGS